MIYYNVYCLKSIIAIDPSRKKKIMGILGGDIPSQRKNRALLKRKAQIVMLSFWLPNYLESACKTWLYRKK